ncbi:MAG: prolipoprotein diacylglyceryl transferase family protein [Anaerolineales bacterium]
MYPFLFTIGLAAGVLWLSLIEPAVRNEKESDVDARLQRLDAALATIAGALLLSRLSFVALHWTQYQKNPGSIFALWQGGLTAWGGALGALIGLGLYCGIRGRICWQTADSLAIAGSLVAMALWLGSLLEGYAYGRAAPASPFAWPAPDLLGQIKPRWPTQSIGALVSIGLLTLGYYGRESGWRAGLASLLIWHGQALTLLILSWLRADPVRYFDGLRSDTLGAGLMLLMGLVLFIYWFSAGELER